jgi:predicted 3-demethylubiquinone-9 3-methyltransferase (glyoxalase superfamily)
MNNSIYPCMWFNDQAKRTVDFYCTLFDNSKILKSNPIVTTFEIAGTKFMALNGGPKYEVSAAVSYYVYCASESKIDQLYELLREEGKVLMPLDKYDWSPRYAWVQDRFGVNWQLDVDDIRASQKIVPTLLFSNEKMGMVKSALDHYTSIFKDTKILLEANYPAEAKLSEGTLLFAQFKLNDCIFNATSSTLKHDFDFSPGNSFVVECENQQEIDHYWERLGKNGRYDMCGWLADQYGVSWQIVPAILSKLMEDPEKGPLVIQAFLKMQKFDIDTLLKA